MYQNISRINKLAPDEKDFTGNTGVVLTAHVCESLKEAMSRIGQLTSNTEEEFLSIGKNLQHYYSSSKEITGIIKNITETISDEILKNGIEQLNGFLLKISDYFTASSSDIERGEVSLNEILSVLNNVVEGLSGFKRIVKHLRMLGISTRIESARLSHDDAGFTSLAENVEKLSGIINDKAANIKEKAGQLTVIIKGTISRVIHLENKQREQSRNTLSSIEGNLAVLNKKYFTCSEKAGVISARSDEISQDISKIVTSIQFHDITRQQIEHVEQALVLADRKINEEVNTPKYSDLLEPYQERVIYVHNVCKLQSLQLKHTKNELSGAVNSIISSLSNVRENVAVVYSEAQQIINDGSGSEGSNIVREIEAGFSEISSSLSKNSAIRVELTNSMKTVTDTIGSLAGYIDEIDEIGSEIELIALNSSIKAAHTGSEGAALGILADSIQRLSNDSKTQTKLVSETLRKVSSASEMLYTNIEYNSDNKSYLELTSIASEISAQLCNLSKYDTETFRKLSGVKDSFERLNEDILRSISKINVHHVSEDTIDLLTNDLDKIVYLVSQSIDHELLNRQENLGELDYQYTMNSERNVHNDFLTASGSVKQASADNKGLEQELSSNEDLGNFEDFGDNVELF